MSGTITRATTSLWQLLGTAGGGKLARALEELSPTIDTRSDMLDGASSIKRSAPSLLSTTTHTVFWTVPPGRVWIPLGGAALVQVNQVSKWAVCIIQAGGLGNYQGFRWASETLVMTPLAGEKLHLIPIPYLPHVVMREGDMVTILGMDEAAAGVFLGYCHFWHADLPGGTG